MTNEEIESRVKFLLSPLRAEFAGPIFRMVFDRIETDLDSSPHFRYAAIRSACLLTILRQFQLTFEERPDRYSLDLFDSKCHLVRTAAYSKEHNTVEEAMLRFLTYEMVDAPTEEDSLTPTVNKGTLLSLVTGAVSPVQPDLSGLFKYLESRGVEVEE